MPLRGYRDRDRPRIIENVVPAPLSPFAITLCGLMFGLKVFRHRRFECSHWIGMPEHPSHKGHRIGVAGMCCVVGNGGGISRRMRDVMARQRRHGAGGQQNKADWCAAMGVDWMTRLELSQTIPPAFTTYLGFQLIALV